jgi:hypothetical protein
MSPHIPIKDVTVTVPTSQNRATNRVQKKRSPSAIDQDKYQSLVLQMSRLYIADRVAQPHGRVAATDESSRMASFLRIVLGSAPCVVLLRLFKAAVDALRRG